VLEKKRKIFEQEQTEGVEKTQDFETQDTRPEKTRGEERRGEIVPREAPPLPLLPPVKFFSFKIFEQEVAEWVNGTWRLMIVDWGRVGQAKTSREPESRASPARPVSFALASQPKHDFIVVHDIIGNQGCSIVNENHAPLQMDTDFIGSPGEFAKAEAAMLMGIAKSCGYF